MSNFRLFICALIVVGGATGRAQASDWSKAFYLPKTPQVAFLRPLNPVYRQIFDSVSKDRIEALLQQLSGALPVTVGGETYSISDRYVPASKAKFRAFWMQYFRDLGLSVQELDYPTQHNIGESQGHNLEAVLPGKSPDSVVIIVHYDSVGPKGSEANNPGVDDDMSGMATLMETARILVEHKAQLQNTVRFVAADYEEQAQPGLEGARQYASFINNLAAEGHFKILAAIDDEQSGWNCMGEHLCKNGDRCSSDTTSTTFDVFSRSADSSGRCDHKYDYQALGDSLEQIAGQYSSLSVSRGCLDDSSDHYAMWEIGVPAVVFSEHSPFCNPHFDSNGGDTYDKIDRDYYFKIARIGVTFAAATVGLE
jgi:hypothetical protein